MWTWSREMLKTRAKDVLRQKYWMIFAACFIAGLLSGGSSFGSGFSNQLSSASYDLEIAMLLAVIYLIVAVAGVALGIFVSNPVSVGFCRYLMEARQGKTDLSTLFWGFREGRYMKIVKTMFFYQLYVILWSCLFIVPGIIKAYEYYYVPYILAENPYIPTERVLQLSRTMTNGEKGKIFVLNLSFLGWWFLGGIACGIGVWFVSPYVSATYAELYAFVRERSFAYNMTGPAELPGVNIAPPFYPYQAPYQPPVNYQQQPYQPPVNYSQPPYQPPENNPQQPPYSQPPAEQAGDEQGKE